MRHRQPLAQPPRAGRLRRSCGCALAVALLAAVGVVLTARYGWLDRDWLWFLAGRPTGIILHHTATPDVVAGQRVDAAFIDREHAKRGFSVVAAKRTVHIGYHYLILRDGTVQSGRPEGVPGSHTIGHNRQLGICLVGNFSSSDNPTGKNGSMRPSRQQLDALDKLLKHLIRKYRFRPGNLHRHRDYAQTACPGDRFPFEAVKRRAFER